MFKLLTLVALVGAVAASPLVRNAAGPILAAKRQCEFEYGSIGVIDSNTGEEYGFVSPTLGNGGYGLVSDYSDALQVSTLCEGDGVGQMYSFNGDTTYPYVALTSPCTSEYPYDIDTSSANYLFISVGPQTDVGSVPSSVGCEPSGSAYSATGIWSLNGIGPAGRDLIGVNWINSDGSSPSSYTAFYWPSQNWVGITGDWESFYNGYEWDGPIYQVDLYLI